MTIQEAIKWLNYECRERAIAELEHTSGIDATDVAISKIYEACDVACEVLRKYLRYIDGLADAGGNNA